MALLEPNTTVGLEVEVQGLPSTALRGIDYLRFSVHNDGSMRGETYCVDGLPLMLTHTDSIGRRIIPSGVADWRAEVIGLELVTRPYKYSQLIPLAKRLADDLAHIPQTDRASIHIHVDVANRSWRYIQRVLKWAFWLEAPIFRIGAAGFRRGHRGSRIDQDGTNNDYRFCRPMSNPIGIQVSGGSRWHPLINAHGLIAATRPQDMLASWGRLDWLWGDIPHYIPHRLHFVNLVSVGRLGTLEWRVFDGVYSAIPTFLQVVMAIHDLALRGVEPEEHFPQPLLLGGVYDLTKEDLERVLKVDLGKVWGKNWQPAPVVIHRSSHYAPMRVPTLSNEPAVRIRGINVLPGQENDDAFVLYGR